MTNVLIDLPEEIHRRLKMLAALKAKKLKEVIIEALGDYVFINEPLEGSFSEMMRDIEENLREGHS